jgi:hypothetical protein
MTGKRAAAWIGSGLILNTESAIEPVINEKLYVTSTVASAPENVHVAVRPAHGLPNVAIPVESQARCVTAATVAVGLRAAKFTPSRAALATTPAK